MKNFFFSVSTFLPFATSRKAESLVCTLRTSRFGPLEKTQPRSGKVKVTSVADPSAFLSWSNIVPDLKRVL